MLVEALCAVARRGRETLLGALVLALLLPDLALAVVPAVPALVAVMLMTTAMRIGGRRARVGLRSLPRTMVLIAGFQLILPVAMLAVAWALGLSGPLMLALVLMASGPAIGGSPSLAVLLGAEPELPFRLLVVGTALLPLTLIPVFWLAPGLGALEEVLIASLRLMTVILGAVVVGMSLRALLAVAEGSEQERALDGATILVISVVAIGLMAQVPAAFSTDPMLALLTLGLAFTANYGLQAVAYLGVFRRWEWSQRTGLSLVAGNRNISLFLTTLPPEVLGPMMVFIGCYQIPMFLSPILMAPMYRRPKAPD